MLLDNGDLGECWPLVGKQRGRYFVNTGVSLNQGPRDRERRCPLSPQRNHSSAWQPQAKPSWTINDSFCPQQTTYVTALFAEVISCY